MHFWTAPKELSISNKNVLWKIWLECSIIDLKKMKSFANVSTKTKIIYLFFQKKLHSDLHGCSNLDQFGHDNWQSFSSGAVLAGKFPCAIGTLNTELWNDATNKPALTVFKQIVRNAFGKFCESKTNQLTEDLFRTAEGLQALVTKTN